MLWNSGHSWNSLTALTTGRGLALPSRIIPTPASATPIPDQAGYIAEQCSPRLFVGFHCYNNDRTHAEIVEGVRKHYFGEFILASDLMVFNVTKTDLKARMTLVDENAYPASNVERVPPPPGAKEKLMKMSPWLAQSRVLPPAS